VSDRHRANGDALATLKLFKILLSKDIDKSIITHVTRSETHGELSHRQLDIVDGIPSETGVYYMHNKDGIIIYIGKSKNMKKSVNQHFTSDRKQARLLQKETKKVTFELTGNELVAILKASEELYRTNPKYNKGHTPFNASKNIPSSKEEIDLSGKDVLVIDKGREIGEHSAILIKNGVFKGLGFYDLNHQINNIHILESIIAPMTGNGNTISIVESYLRRRSVLQIIDLNSTI